MSQPTSNKKRKQPGSNKASLSSLLRYMEGMELIVELKTGRRYRGTLSSADDAMDLILNNCTEVGKQTSSSSSSSSSQGEESTITASTTNNNNNNNNNSGNEETNILKISSLDAMMSIRGSNIRCIHFPDNADLKGTVASGIERERAASNKYKRGKRK